MFAGIRAETDWDIDAEMLWSYYFTAAAPEVLETVAEALEARDFEAVEIFEDEDQPLFALQVERSEKHTPESLFALNNELEALAATFKGVEYDGMDVNPFGDEDGCGCEGDCKDCDCDKEEEEHECCGGGHGGCGCEDDHKEESHACRCGSKHYQSENEPIENPDLVAAMDKITHDLSEENQQNLTLELQRGLYLVPVFTGRIDTDPTDDETMQVLVCTDETDAEYLPLFTDEAALKAWTQENVSAMVLTAPEAWEFILSQPECSGGVVNPGDAGLPLNRDMVTLLKKMIDAVEVESGE